MTCETDMYFDPGAKLCLSCSDVCNRDVDPELKRDCMQYCPATYVKMMSATELTFQPVQPGNICIPLWSLYLCVVVIALLLLEIIWLRFTGIRTKVRRCFTSLKNQIGRSKRHAREAVELDEASCGKGHGDYRLMHALDDSGRQTSCLYQPPVGSHSLPSNIHGELPSRQESQIAPNATSGSGVDQRRQPRSYEDSGLSSTIPGPHATREPSAPGVSSYNRIASPEDNRGTSKMLMKANSLEMVNSERTYAKELC